MFFSGIIVKQSFEIINEVMLFVGDLQIGHDDVVGSISPAIVIRIVDTVCFT